MIYLHSRFRWASSEEVIAEAARSTETESFASLVGWIDYNRTAGGFCYHQPGQWVPDKGHWEKSSTPISWLTWPRQYLLVWRGTWKIQSAAHTRSAPGHAFACSDSVLTRRLHWAHLPMTKDTVLSASLDEALVCPGPPKSFKSRVDELGDIIVQPHATRPKWHFAGIICIQDDYLKSTLAVERVFAPRPRVRAKLF